MYMGKDLIVDKFYQMIDHLNEKRIIPVQFCLININKLKPLYDGMEEHQFANNDEIIFYLLYQIQKVYKKQ